MSFGEMFGVVEIDLKVATFCLIFVRIKCEFVFKINIVT